MVKIRQVKVEKIEQAKKYMCEIYGTTFSEKVLREGEVQGLSCLEGGSGRSRIWSHESKLAFRGP